MALLKKKEKEKNDLLKTLIEEKNILVDIDQIEEIANDEARKSEAKVYSNEVKEILQKDNVVDVSVKFDVYQYIFIVKIDLTSQCLKNENEYRKSEVERIIDPIIENLNLYSERQYYYPFNIKLEAYITLNGKEYLVYEKSKVYEPF